TPRPTPLRPRDLPGIFTSEPRPYRVLRIARPRASVALVIGVHRGSMSQAGQRAIEEAEQEIARLEEEPDQDD
ncbi:MAG: hypothetical protein AAFZ18_20475, partial [Myxococcota bacterium]